MTAASDFLARAAAAGNLIPLSYDQALYTTFINALVGHGLMSDSGPAKLDGLWVFAAPNVGAAKLNLVSSSFTIVSHGTDIDTLGFTAYQGFTGNGTDRYLDTQCAPSSGTLLYSQTSASFGAYAATSVTSDSGSPFILGAEGVTFPVAFLSTFVNFPFWGINMSTVEDYGTGIDGNQKGFYIVSNPSSGVQNAYKNGTVRKSTTDANATIAALPSFCVLASNGGGGVVGFWPNQVGMAFVGSGLTATDAANFNTDWNAFLAGVGQGSAPPSVVLMGQIWM